MLCRMETVGLKMFSENNHVLEVIATLVVESYCGLIIGGRTRARTWDPLIKSQLLYQLSYAPDTNIG
jgi:hypothetical protein